jgi:aspartate-semialdehyde dehydrogenase
VTQASQTAERSSSAGVGTKTVAVIGATGAVGAEMLRCLETSSYPTGTLKAFASERSAGKRFKFLGKDVEMQVLTDDAFAGVDVALFASETDISKKYVPLAVQAGAYAIDNSCIRRAS